MFFSVITVTICLGASGVMIGFMAVGLKTMIIGGKSNKK